MLIVFAALVATSCRKDKNSYDEIGESGLTLRTENLRANLLPYEDKGVMLGQMYGTTEGIGWTGDSARSDLYEISGDMPACIGFELAGIEKGNTINADSISFKLIKRDIISYFQRQGLVVLYWTAPDPGKNPLENGSKANTTLHEWTKKTAEYIGTLQNAYGIKVPIVLALYPLDSQSWYSNISADDYKKLYTMTTGWMKDEGKLNNAIFAFSNNDIDADAEEFMNRCPLEIIDVIQLTYMPEKYEEYGTRLLHQARRIADISLAKMKAFGIKTGVKAMGNDPEFWTKNIVPVIENCRMSYMLLGRNHGDFKNGDFCVPYPGSESVSDFMKLYNNPRLLMMNKVNGLLVNHYKK